MRRYTEHDVAPGLLQRLRAAPWLRTATLVYGLVVTAVVVVAYLCSHLGLLPDDPYAVDYSMMNALPSSGHWLGTDDSGRDLLARIMVGTQAFFLPGLLSVSVSLIGGALLGVLAGYWPERFATLVGILLQLVESLPKLVLVLLVIALFKPNIYLILLVVGLTNIPAAAELLRARIAVLRRKSYIEAAIALGLPSWRVILKHVLWLHGRGLVLIQASVGMAEAILIETSLSYLGFGVQEPNPSWGNMVEIGKNYFFRGELWISTVPALAILVAILGFYLLSDALLARLEERGAQ
jgi:peptide/nickel transport system permease protein